MHSHREINSSSELSFNNKTVEISLEHINILCRGRIHFPCLFKLLSCKAFGRLSERAGW